MVRKRSKMVHVLTRYAGIPREELVEKPDDEIATMVDDLKLAVIVPDLEEDQSDVDSIRISRILRRIRRR